MSYTHMTFRTPHGEVTIHKYEDGSMSFIMEPSAIHFEIPEMESFRSFITEAITGVKRGCDYCV